MAERLRVAEDRTGTAEVSGTPRDRRSHIADSRLEEFPRTGASLAGKFELGQKLGAGGMGVVFGARDLRLGHEVAIKFLNPELVGRSASVKRFLREARALAAISHENVIRVLDVGLFQNTPFLVMERLTGQDLGQLLSECGPLAIRDVASYVAEACAGVASAHERGITHRDLKPANLFLCSNVDSKPRIKVLDFGISKAHSTDSDLTHDLTLTGTVMLGSPQFMAPEQIRDAKSVDQRADIWSLGVIIYKLVSDRFPFEGDSPQSLAVAISTDTPKPLRESRPNVPRSFERIVTRCLEKDPARRYASALDLRQALLNFIDHEVNTPRRLPSKRAAVWGLAICGVLASAATARLWFRDAPEASATMPEPRSPAPTMKNTNAAHERREATREGTGNAIPARTAQENETLDGNDRGPERTRRRSAKNVPSARSVEHESKTLPLPTPAAHDLPRTVQSATPETSKPGFERL